MYVFALHFQHFVAHVCFFLQGQSFNRVIKLLINPASSNMHTGRWPIATPTFEMDQITFYSNKFSEMLCLFILSWHSYNGS